ncbi:MULTISPECIES: hypothetical protein [Streptomyces]|uniref:Uncharacterized protein n=1 Tax=Streptomyces coelicolor (strain ATCC BAA-471 / A3(2) / M145) TaxID=100226 RepID=Q9RKM7_STRCO|nr:MULTISPECIES: hypothetical protein [Streptomyces]MDX2929008.1 hypothetical protein [Streptomyces sp. NRRL_B-16638]MYU43621.1 hypothetical protein [Streptomyces sp. SID7813]NSL84538.1 hypothetical protein [Streptomyces coelicolor]QFI44076.1 hypothetical protein FQ762_21180 [Streptomyces coelicolor A3(2)]QKN67715.1 hypothetical protein HCU77_20880 [Streptomyces coelicolor]
MSTTPPGDSLVDLRPRRVTPRRLGAAAVVYGVFVAGWYLGQPVTPECHVDRAALDRAAERYRPEPSPTPTYSPIPSPSPSAYPGRSSLADAHTAQGPMVMSLTYTSYAVACTNDMGERPRLRAWFDGGRE